MDPTVNDETLPENKPCAKVPTSPSKIPISPTRRPVHLLTPSNHQLKNSHLQQKNSDESNDNGGKSIDSSNKALLHSNDARKQSKEENREKNNCRPGCCLSTNCSSSTSSIQHNSRLKGHQANNNLVNLRMSHASDGYKSHRSLSPPSSNMTTSSSNSIVASTTNSLNRISLQQLSSGKKAKRIKLYRNGDKFFKGIIYPLSVERIRTFDAFLEDLTRILVDQVSAQVVFK